MLLNHIILSLWGGTLGGGGIACAGITLGLWLILSHEATFLLLTSDMVRGFDRNTHLKFGQGIIWCAVHLSSFPVSCSEKTQVTLIIRQYLVSTHPLYNRYKPLEVKANTDEDDGSPRLEVSPR